MLLPHILTFSLVLFSVTLTTSTIIQIKVKALGNNNIKLFLNETFTEMLHNYHLVWSFHSK